MWVYMCVCVETGGRGEGDGSTCEMAMKGSCVEGVGGPARRPEGREGQQAEEHRNKKIEIAYVHANAIRKPTCALTLKINIKRREPNVLRPGLDCPLYCASASHLCGSCLCGHTVVIG